ncbi:transcription antitermination factor NusB [Metamycoplasma buccale]|uniref:transcription antitermination factor NusB n=1 Tax=Metamycoplasma buccale TaxID=55602 RepID=UPI00398E5592
MEIKSNNEPENKQENKLIFQLKQYEKRKTIINYIYQSELEGNSKINVTEIFRNNDLNKHTLKILTIIEEKYDFLKKIICSTFNEDWTWERVLPLLRAILIYGSFELIFNKKEVVINELVNITKIFMPGDYYKFVNKSLDLISKIIEKK